MSTYTMSHQELEHMLRRQAQMIAEHAYPDKTARERDEKAALWATMFTQRVLMSVGMKGRE